MLQRGLALTCVALVATTLVGAVASSAEAGAPGITLSGVASARTVYNHQATIIEPRAHVRPGVHRQVTGLHVRVYRGGHLVDSGADFHAILTAGNYRMTVRVPYRTYRLVSRTRTVRVFREGDMPTHSRCVVTQADNYGAGDDYILASVCTNPRYPEQIVHDSYTDTATRGPYTVGQVVYSSWVDFNGQYVRVIQHYTARSYTGRGVRLFTRYVTVRDGGYRRLFHGWQSGTTHFFSIPRGAGVYYAYNCGDYAGNWIVWRHEYGTPSYTDDLLSNVIHHRGYGRYHFPHSGRYRYQVITECSWSISVYWH